MPNLEKNNQRHKTTSRDFMIWIRQNPNATHKRKFEQFDAIADNNYNTELQNRKSRKLIKRI